MSQRTRIARHFERHAYRMFAHLVRFRFPPMSHGILTSADEAAIVAPA